MAFPTRDTRTTLSFAREDAMAIAGQVKQRSQDMRIFLGASSASANLVLEYAEFLQGAKAGLNKYKAVPGIVAFARDQLGDQTRDIAAEFDAMVAGIDGALAWIVGNFPKSAGGFLEKDTLNADGSLGVRSFAPAQTAGFGAALDGLLAAIA